MTKQSDYQRPVQPIHVKDGWPTDEGPIATLRQVLNDWSDEELALVSHDGTKVELQFPDFVGYGFVSGTLCEHMVFEIGVLTQNGWHVQVAPEEDPDEDTLCVRVLIVPVDGERCGDLRAA